MKNCMGSFKEKKNYIKMAGKRKHLDQEKKDKLILLSNILDKLLEQHAEMDLLVKDIRTKMSSYDSVVRFHLKSLNINSKAQTQKINLAKLVFSSRGLE